MIAHGYSKYTNEGCRCDICKAAQKEYWIRYQETRGKMGIFKRKNKFSPRKREARVEVNHE